MSMCRVPVLARTLAVGAVAAALSGCAMEGLCLFGCGSERSGTTSLVQFLYPGGEVPPHDATAQLRLPMVVGLIFLPSAPGDLIEATVRQATLDKVRASFRALPYVRDIVIVPEHYLTSRGFESLQQISRLQAIDVFAIVSSDQVSHHDETSSSVAYLTIVGAYFVRGSKSETHTLIDLAVVEPASRSLLLRAAGTSALEQKSTAVEHRASVREQQSRGFEAATEQLVANVRKELETFEARVKEGTAPVTVTHRQGRPGAAGGGGSLDGAMLALLGGTLLAARRRRRALSSSSVRGFLER